MLWFSFEMSSGLSLKTRKADVFTFLMFSSAEQKGHSGALSESLQLWKQWYPGVLKRPSHTGFGRTLATSPLTYL